MFLIFAGCRGEIKAKAARKPDVSYKTESLEVLAETAIKNIDIKKIESLVAQLHTDDESKRLKVLKEIKAETGQDHFYSPLSEQDQNKKDQELEEWAKYSQKLQVAIKEKVPEVLGRLKPVVAIEYLGSVSPHKAFLPLLKKIAANPKVDWSLRKQTLDTIVCIQHDGMIEYLVELLADDVLCEGAWNHLKKLTRIPRRVYGTEDTRIPGVGLNFKAVQKVFRKWWETHKDEYKYRRVQMMWT